MKKVIVIVVLLAVFALGYTVHAANGWVRLSDQQDFKIYTDNQHRVEGIRFHDDEKNVTCWASTEYYGSNGISCLPDKDLTK